MRNSLKITPSETLSSLEVAYVFLDIAAGHKSRKGLPLTFTKEMLQKLVMITHGFHLAIYGTPLVIDDNAKLVEGSPNFNSFLNSKKLAGLENITIDDFKKSVSYPGHITTESYDIIERVFLSFVAHGHFLCDDLDYYFKNLAPDNHELSDNVIKVRFNSELDHKLHPPAGLLRAD